MRSAYSRVVVAFSTLTKLYAEDYPSTLTEFFSTLSELEPGGEIWKATIGIVVYVAQKPACKGVIVKVEISIFIYTQGGSKKLAG